MTTREGFLRSIAEGPAGARLRVRRPLGVPDLVRRPQLAGLTELLLSGCYLRRPDCEALASAPGLPSLRRLSVPYNRLDLEGALTLLAPAAFPALTDLDLRWQFEEGGGVESNAPPANPLAGHPALGRLRGLALATSPHLGALRRGEGPVRVP